MESKKRPEWFNKVINQSDLTEMKKLIGGYDLNIVCEEDFCPNRGECYQDKTLTVRILEETLIKNTNTIDEDEPYRVAEAISKLNLDYVIITSVRRDDLEDGGAEHFAKTITELKRKSPKTTLEVLVPDFVHSIHKVVEAKPEVISHNIKTIPRLYKELNPKASYDKSLALLSVIKKTDPKIYTKSGLMLGSGEEYKEVLEALEDLASIECDIINIGQYVKPSKQHTEVVEWIHPYIFQKYKKDAYELGFLHVESEPYARISFHAAEFVKKIGRKK